MITNLLLALSLTFVPIKDQPYEVATTETTQKCWKEVMGSNPSHFKGDNLPVESVNYDDILKFIDKLNAKDPKYIYRLPSNSEWLELASGGAKTRYWFGDSEEELRVAAWFRGNSSTPMQDAKGNWYSAPSSPHPVGTKMANQFGLHDVLGSVWEWSAEGNIRGGAHWSTALDCSLNYVSKWPRSERSEFVGFRLVRESKKPVATKEKKPDIVETVIKPGSPYFNSEEKK